ncbi:hypothetical protein [Pantoea sp. BAV 3049]|uniref:glycine-rich domain-containing protein n=1 Tax=Pantoea sp. BAV 3049 TaxID=2654188 RepID=UPI00131ECB25|nr:hypothetical protein [Pantoea sp. BAV 3049]
MALTLLASNNATSVLASSISATATTLSVNSGTGSLFPSPVNGTSYFKLTLVDAATGTLTEIVHVTARSADVFTIQRAQEGTTARIWSANDIAANMMTAGTLSVFAQKDLSLQINNNLSEINTAGPDAVNAALTNLGLITGGAVGRLLGPPKIFTASGNYTPTDGTKMIVVEVQGSGGGGGGSGTTGSSACSSGAGGGAGGYAMSLLTSGFSDGVAITVGSAGSGGSASPGNGVSGGSVTFGSFITCTGGGGGVATSASPPFSCAPGTPGTATGGNIVNKSGSGGMSSLFPSVNSGSAGAGGSSQLGTGGYATTVNSTGSAGTGYGAGGGGAFSSVSTSGKTGGAGSGGVVIVWEYA